VNIVPSEARNLFSTDAVVEIPSEAAGNASLKGILRLLKTIRFSNRFTSLRMTIL